ncbi:GL27198 [Drosophila persimilis]|uniref:GL27198 n=1 Tax=Drosophila persimilis TaxID=7234 RepID=B4GZ12_DROPE|nr:GL27198 [Drosophila persimilis]
MQSRLMFIVLYGIFFASTFDYNDAVVFKFTNFVCESYNQSLFVFNYCRLKAVSRNKVIFNMNGTLLHSANNVWIHSQIFKRANGYRPWLYEVKFDACQYFRRPNNPLVAIVYGLFKEYTNINHTCPYVGPQIIKDFYLRPELLRVPLPTGDYLLMIRWYFEKRLQFDTNVTFVFEEDLMKRN